MRVVVQRVSSASVIVDEDTIARIDQGIVALVGIAAADTPADAAVAAKKIAEMRIFSDDAGKMNRSIEDVGGAVMVVSQFTLCADIARGRRPSFTPAAHPDIARPLVDAVCNGLAERGIPVVGGVFGAYMTVDLVNDGPVTFVIDVVDGQVA